MCSEKGQTLLELVVVVAVSVIIVGALVFATIASLRNAQFSKNQALATKLAQEGIERVRIGRDRNICINNMTGFTPPVNSWNGESSNTGCPGPGAIWSYHISGDCDRPDLTPPALCVFNIGPSGQLTLIISGFQPTASNPLPSGAETPSGSTAFKRVILLSDKDDFGNQKEITAVVAWTDFSGYHESRITTVLRRI